MEESELHQVLPGVVSRPSLLETASPGFRKPRQTSTLGDGLVKAKVGPEFAATPLVRKSSRRSSSCTVPRTWREEVKMWCVRLFRTLTSHASENTREDDTLIHKISKRARALVIGSDIISESNRGEEIGNLHDKFTSQLYDAEVEFSVFDVFEACYGQNGEDLDISNEETTNSPSKTNKRFSSMIYFIVIIQKHVLMTFL